jgi:hypothetical protein
MILDTFRGSLPKTSLTEEFRKSLSDSFRLSLDTPMTISETWLGIKVWTRVIGKIRVKVLLGNDYTSVLFSFRILYLLLII